MSRNKWIATEPQTIIETPNRRRQVGIKSRLARENRRMDDGFLEARKAWVFIPPSNMTIVYRGLVLIVPHSVGALLLYRRDARIFERGVIIDADLSGNSYEQVLQELRI